MFFPLSLVPIMFVDDTVSLFCPPRSSYHSPSKIIHNSHAIEEELEVLYDAYYEELEQYANYQQRYVNSGGTLPPPPGPGPFPGSVELDKNGAVVNHSPPARPVGKGAAKQQQQINGRKTIVNATLPIPPSHLQGHHPQALPHTHPHPHAKESEFDDDEDPGEDEYEEDDDDEYEEDEEEEDDDEDDDGEEEDDGDEEDALDDRLRPVSRRNDKKTPARRGGNPPVPPAQQENANGRQGANGVNANASDGLFNLKNSLTVTGMQFDVSCLLRHEFIVSNSGPGNILTVADDLLKNDGQKFLEMMEQLAERRMQREEEAAGDVEDDSDEDDDDRSRRRGDDDEEDDEDDEEDDEDEDEDDEDEDDEEEEVTLSFRLSTLYSRS